MITSEEAKTLSDLLTSAGPLSTDERHNKRLMFVLYKLDLYNSNPHPHFTYTVDSWDILRLVTFP